MFLGGDNISFSNKIGVIADDLTGAIEVGMEFKKRSYRTIVLLDLSSIKDLIKDFDVIVVCTQNRNVPEEQAREITKKAVKILMEIGIKYFYNKIDSTLRGNLGAIIDEISRILDRRLVFFAPAVPENKRTTKNGYQYIDGVPIAKTEMSEDLLAPIGDSYIPNILQEQCGLNIELVSLNKLYSKNFSRQIQQINDKSVLVIDAEGKEDLREISSKLKGFSSEGIFCGSAGLAGELASIWSGKNNNNDHLYNNNTVSLDKHKHKPVIVISGSVKNETDKQIKYLRENDIAVSIEINTENIIRGAKLADKELKRVIKETEADIYNGNNIIYFIKKINLSSNKEDKIRASILILNFLTGLAKSLINNTQISGLVLIGGDVAASVCKELGINGVIPYEQISTLTSLTYFYGEHYSGIKCVTKGGAVGEQELLYHIISYLRGNEDNGQ